MANVKCKTFGHDWDWPRITLMLSPEGMSIERADRQCLRCRIWEVDACRRTVFQSGTVIEPREDD